MGLKGNWRGNLYEAGARGKLKFTRVNRIIDWLIYLCKITAHFRHTVRTSTCCKSNANFKWPPMQEPSLLKYASLFFKKKYVSQVTTKEHDSSWSIHSHHRHEPDKFTRCNLLIAFSHWWSYHPGHVIHITGSPWLALPAKIKEWNGICQRRKRWILHRLRQC
jgi:hypothetical protein